jgi:hypothetical protein
MKIEKLDPVERIVLNIDEYKNPERFNSLNSTPQWPFNLLVSGEPDQEKLMKLSIFYLGTRCIDCLMGKKVEQDILKMMI